MARRIIAASLVILALILSVTAAMAAGPSLKLIKSDAAVVVELDKQAQTEGVAYYKNSKGVVSGPFKIKGVKLADLINLAGGMSASEKLVMVSSDGYVTELDYGKLNGEMAATRPDGSPVEGKPVMVPVLITWSDPGMEEGPAEAGLPVLCGGRADHGEQVLGEERRRDKDCARRRISGKNE